MERSNMKLNNLNMVNLRALAKEHNLRGYSRLRKNDLIAIISTSLYRPQTNDDRANDDRTKDNTEPSKELTKRQRKRMAQKASRTSKKSKKLRADINDLKSQKDDLEEKINRVSNTTSAKFKGKKLRSMKREAAKLNEQI